MRQILQVETNAIPLVGTWHRPADGGAAAAAKVLPPAVVLLNFGHLCRSGPSAICVEMADRLCAEGYPVFRFDMPGLGDTPGELPGHQETYWNFVESGGHTPWICSLLDVLKRQYSLPGFILGGLCGGAITSTFVAERRADVLGLLLMEQAIRLTPYVHDETWPGAQFARPQQGLWKRCEGYWSRFDHRARLWVRRTKCLGPLRRTWQAAERKFWDLRRGHLPAMMNAPLIRCWQKVQATGLPMLVMTAPGNDREFVKQTLFPEGQRKQMVMVDLDQTNHLFTAGNGKQRAVDEAARWMLRTYPLTDGRRPAGQCDDRSAAASLAGTS